tara:strand:+ start:2048 stop:2644 length:597 start_codon:yes stop_codon:yes gene_type:complete
MTNSARPFGLKAITNNGICKFGRYFAPASLASLGINTPVNLGGTSNSSNTTNGQLTPAGTIPSIVVATGGTTNKLLGSIVGFEVLPTDLFKAGYNAASTARIVYVADDINQEFAIVDDGAGTLAITDVGLNANITVGTVNAFTNVDSSSLDTTTPATTVGFQLKILSLLDVPLNEVAVYATWRVKINNHVLANAVIGA